ncbi:hypothetical protein AVEN_132031-1 [Araneus ventricosus]|uniref:Uncharacterized protein n=1 Tax=Araneus ventricosus TaxID=182803 RepID=A0A4Y2KA95_ARAVE|nr:hypothetical protein AVEN_255784-1 [Araneus ventricosus]GBM98901.1 hypothetical protein AVEN_273368-1 [Araneus ventricosus]GBM98906.1 hypothetical protein AVEN_20459-1 [Araneus ventricosus]GBM98916.1 hypothetical protein AVEN_132031-1 [Araneus ventricosus]
MWSLRTHEMVDYVLGMEFRRDSCKFRRNLSIPSTSAISSSRIVRGGLERSATFLPRHPMHALLDSSRVTPKALIPHDKFYEIE